MALGPMHHASACKIIERLDKALDAYNNDNGDFLKRLELIAAASYAVGYFGSYLETHPAKERVQ